MFLIWALASPKVLLLNVQRIIYRAIERQISSQFSERRAQRATNQALIQIISWIYILFFSVSVCLICAIYSSRSALIRDTFSPWPMPVCCSCCPTLTCITVDIIVHGQDAATSYGIDRSRDRGIRLKFVRTGRPTVDRHHLSRTNTRTHTHSWSWPHIELARKTA